MADQDARELTEDADRRLAALSRSVVNGQPCSEHGKVGRGVLFVLAAVGLAVWGWSNGSSAPDGRWLLAMLIVGVMLAGLVSFGRSYRAAEHRSAAYTEKVEGRVQQHQGSDHHLDGA